MLSPPYFELENIKSIVDSSTVFGIFLNNTLPLIKSRIIYD